MFSGNLPRSSRTLTLLHEQRNYIRLGDLVLLELSFIVASKLSVLVAKTVANQNSPSHFDSAALILLGNEQPICSPFCPMWKKEKLNHACSLVYNEQ